jgi:hypothetical protein
MLRERRATVAANAAAAAATAAAAAAATDAAIDAAGAADDDDGDDAAVAAVAAAAAAASADVAASAAAATDAALRREVREAAAVDMEVAMATARRDVYKNAHYTAAAAAVNFVSAVLQRAQAVNANAVAAPTAEADAQLALALRVITTLLSTHPGGMNQTRYLLQSHVLSEMLVDLGRRIIVAPECRQFLLLARYACAAVAIVCDNMLLLTVSLKNALLSL